MTTPENYADALVLYFEEQVEELKLWSDEQEELCGEATVAANDFKDDVAAEAEAEAAEAKAEDAAFADAFAADPEFWMNSFRGRNSWMFA